MRHYELRTVGAISLDGPAGPVPLDEPHLVALLVMLAVAEPGGVRDDELQLRLFPNATSRHARAELARLLAVLRLRLGGEHAVRTDGEVHALAPGLVRLDVRVLPEPRAEERADFLAGFRLPSSPEFRDWLADVRRRVEPVQRSPAGVRRAGTRGARVLGVALLLVLLGAAALVWRSRASGDAPGAAIILADVANETGDSLFDGLLRAATLGLEQSRHVQLYPRRRLPDVLRRMQLPGDTALSFALAHEVAEREGVRFVLGLRVGREQNAYRITAELADVARGGTRSHGAVADRQEDVIGALGDVLRDVRRQLGEPRAELAERAAPLPQVTTSSLEALRSFAAGGAAWDRGEFGLARDLWLRAADLDTAFASALGNLGQYYFYHHDRDRGRRYYGAALAHAERLTERERLRLEASWAADRGDTDSAIASFHRLAEGYPSAGTWENYGTMLLRAQQNAEAVPAFRRALAFDSTSRFSSTIWINLATVLGRLDRDDEAIEAYHRAGMADSTILFRGNLNHEYGAKLVRLGRLAEAESAYARMARGPTLAARSAGYRSLGYLAVWRGRIDEGAAHFERASQISAEDGKPLTEARNRMLLAWTHRLAGRGAAADAALDRVLRYVDLPSFEPTFLSFVVAALVRQGRVAEAETVLRTLRGRADSSNAADASAASLSAAFIALARARPADALELVRAAGAYLQPLRAQVMAAEIHAAAGSSDTARALLAEALRGDAFGAEAQEDWLRASVLLGDLRLGVGDTAGAREAWMRSYRHWADVPAMVPAVADLRARLVSIGGAGDR
jgi:tetratricopeptide (TPR) repeat protein